MKRLLYGALIAAIIMVPLGAWGASQDFKGTISGVTPPGITKGTITISSNNMTVVGGTGLTYSTDYTQIGNLVVFHIRVNPNGGTTASTEGVTHIATNLPAMEDWGNGIVVDTYSSVSLGNAQAGPDIWLPTWDANSRQLVVSGSYLTAP